MLVELNGVSKAFKGVPVLNKVDLSIGEREIFGLIGPSGAGKTTLIRLIIGAIAADGGEIAVDGHKIPDLSVLHEIGYMPQNDALYNDLTGMENLIFFGGMYASGGKALRARAKEMLQLVELSDAGGRRVGVYSSGMKKRLSLAIALMHDPKILILDEPTVGIDPILRRKIWNRFEALRDLNRTVLVTTHVMDEAERCDRLALVYGGGILACDSTAKLLERSGGSIESLFFEKEGAR
jgi:ABC-2 type transport system ATP-binding protein